MEENRELREAKAAMRKLYIFIGTCIGVICAVVAIVMLIAMFVFGTNPETPAGHEGYVYEKPRFFGNGGFMEVQNGPQNFGISLWRNIVINVDYRPKTYGENFQILAKDELNVKFRFQSIIKPRPGTVKEVVEKYSGDKFYKRFIKEPLRSMVRKQVQELNARVIKSKREVIADAVLVELRAYLKDTPFMVTKGVVGNIDYPDSVEKAVELAIAAQQTLEKKKVELDIAAKDAEILIVEAQGIAESQRIINRTLTDRYLQHEAIKAQKKMADSANHTTVYIPSGNNGIPIIRTIK